MSNARRKAGPAPSWTNHWMEQMAKSSAERRLDRVERRLDRGIKRVADELARHEAFMAQLKDEQHKSATTTPLPDLRIEN